MKLQDYLHYYIGCKVMAAPYGGQQKRYEEGKLVGINVYDIANVKLNNWQSVADINIECVKPILRRLADLTRDEMKIIWNAIIGRPFPDTGNILWFDKETSTSCKRWGMMSGVDRVGIELNGNVWADCDLSHIKFNPNLIAHFLIKQGFDIFGLIDAGLAIDQKTTNGPRNHSGHTDQNN